MSSEPQVPEPAPRARAGWAWVGVASLLYCVGVAAATWPRVAWFRTHISSLGDPLQHLWIMRWYRTCLSEGRSVVLCPEIQYPIGVPLGCFSPLHFQSLLYIPLSLAIENDVLCYNLLWLLGVVFTGVATALLVRQTVGDPWCAGFGGMLAMLSGPMMLHAMAHLELIYLGGFPLFLWGWFRFVDQPSRGRLAAAAALYLMLALIAAYYAVFAVFPAALYVGWRLAGLGPRGAWEWIRSRVGWLVAFSVPVVPGLVLAFGNQLWALAHGYVIGRPLSEYLIHGAPLWSYAVPTFYHPLGRLLPASPYVTSGISQRIGECGSYLGIVALGLVGYAAACRVRFPKATFWWSALVLVVVLSGGAYWSFGGHELPLPGLWLKKNVFLFRLIRVPARFNLFAVVIAAVVASNGLRHLLERLPDRRSRALVFVTLAAAAVADLAVVPAYHAPIPAMPGCYAYMKHAAPDGAFVEIPQFSSGGSQLYAVTGYWQSIHRGRSGVGYSGQSNAVFDNLLSWNSPFAASRLVEPEYLRDGEHVSIDVSHDVRFDEYAWLYLTANRFRFVVLHQWAEAVPDMPVRLDRLKAALGVAKVFEDAGSVVYDLHRLPRPTRPVVLTLRGWRPAWGGKLVRVANREAGLAVYNPDARVDLQLTLNAGAFRHARHVRLREGERTLAEWDVPQGGFRPVASPTFRLPDGFHELVLESDGDDRPRSWRDASFVGDLNPYSLKVEAVGLEVVPAVARR